MNFHVYTDGSGTTGGPAGIAYVAFEQAAADVFTLWREDALPVENATNQQAEILAAAYALHQLPERSTVTIFSDSEYLVKGYNVWLPQWLENGWKKLTGGEPANGAHWKRLVTAAERHESVTFQWLKGHDGHEHNERADQLAGEARAMAMSV